MTSISAYKGAIRSRTEIGKLRLSGTDPFLLTTQIISSTTRPGFIFERALSIARQQQAKSWDLRAAMSSRASGVLRTSRGKLADCWIRLTAGSLRGLKRAI